jgi:hypothetical protein
MLATVGYGDYYPISNIEMVASVVIMLACVASFSFIMSSFMEIIRSYNKKMKSTPDFQENFQIRITSLERYNKGSPMPLSLVQEMTKDTTYFAYNNRIAFLGQDPRFLQLPRGIMQEIVANFLYSDVTTGFNRFFSKFRKDSQFIYDMSAGFMPRFFESSNQVDKVIYEEDQEVSEMYFVTKGQIGFAINAFQNKIHGSFY